MRTFKVYTDGSCIGNPGPGGWAFIVIKKDGSTRTVCGNDIWTTNNEMEAEAILQVVTAAHDNDILEIYTDSQLMIGLLDGTFKRRVIHLREMCELIDRIVEHKGLTLSLNYVQGHNGNKYNELANKLAQDQAKLAKKQLEKN